MLGYMTSVQTNQSDWWRAGLLLLTSGWATHSAKKLMSLSPGLFLSLSPSPSVSFSECQTVHPCHKTPSIVHIEHHDDGKHQIDVASWQPFEHPARAGVRQHCCRQASYVLTCGAFRKGDR